MTAAPNTRRRVHVSGMDCSEEVSVVREALAGLPGVENFVPDLATGIVTVTVTPSGPTAEEIATAIQGRGLGAQPVSQDGPQLESWWSRHGRASSTAAAALLTGIGFAAQAGQVGISADLGEATLNLPARLAFAMALVLSAGPIVPRAWGTVRSLRLDMNVLLVIAVAGAIALGDWFEAAAVATLFALSLVLETWTARRSRRAISELLATTPTTARIKDPTGEEREIPVADVAIGMRLVIKPGETIPVDGTIVAGTSSINQAPITGESQPVVRTVGGEVFAGCVNGEGALEMTATQQAGDTVLARIARLVTESQAKRGTTERWLDRFSRVYTPGMLLLAVLVALIPGAVTGHWSWWGYQALVLLVIACPCALVISVPVCIVAGIATAARKGVIVKGGAALETAARIQVVAFDKTGTLTTGKPSVVMIKPLGDASEEAILAAAAALEARSEHPVARAILGAAADRGLIPAPADDVRAIPGRGVESPSSGTWAGSVTWAEERGALNDAARIQLAGLAHVEATVLVIGKYSTALGFVACQDQQRPDAAPALAALRGLRISRLIMLSGDAEAVVKRVAASLGITEAHGGLLPAAKVERIARLADDRHPLAMVGDGLNDAPALARADLGVAMGEGSAATLETADVALLTNDLMRLPWLIAHARRVLGVMRQNVAAAILIKVIVIVIAIAGHGSLWAAIAADTGVALLVVLNALRLLRPSTVSLESHP